jgi:hypothetical protein
VPDIGKERRLKQVSQESSVHKISFTAEEFEEFKERFDRTPSWSRWQRRDGENGEDVLEISIDGEKPVMLKVAKTPKSGFLATGYDGWALMVAEEFGELLQVLASMNHKRKAAISISWPVAKTA